MPSAPLVKLPSEPDRADIWLEAGNPIGSYKERMARAMIEGATEAGKLAPGQPVSNTTGAAPEARSL